MQYRFLLLKLQFPPTVHNAIYIFPFVEVAIPRILSTCSFYIYIYIWYHAFGESLISLYEPNFNLEQLLQNIMFLSSSFDAQEP